MARSQATTDHEKIRKWVESKGGCPARVKGTGNKNDPGLIRIDFPGFSGKDTLEPISWDEFFEKFDEAGLAFVYQDGPNTRFNKLVKRETVEEKSRTSTRKRGTGSRKNRTSSRSRGTAQSGTGRKRSTRSRQARKQSTGQARKRSTAKRSSPKKATTKRRLQR
jgi:hypothetical protein